MGRYRLCPRGHYAGREFTFCPEHGAPLYDVCKCKAEWVDHPNKLWEVPADFCVSCGRPAPWVSRKDLIGWIKDRLAFDELDRATALSLREILDRLAEMDPNDDKTVTAWNTIKEKAPKALQAARPFLPDLIGPAVRALLDWWSK